MKTTHDIGQDHDAAKICHDVQNDIVSDHVDHDTQNDILSDNTIHRVPNTPHVKDWYTILKNWSQSYGVWCDLQTFLSYVVPLFFVIPSSWVITLSVVSVVVCPLVLSENTHTHQNRWTRDKTTVSLYHILFSYLFLYSYFHESTWTPSLINERMILIYVKKVFGWCFQSCVIFWMICCSQTRTGVFLRQTTTQTRFFRLIHLLDPFRLFFPSLLCATVSDGLLLIPHLNTPSLSVGQKHLLYLQHVVSAMCVHGLVSWIPQHTPNKTMKNHHTIIDLYILCGVFGVVISPSCLVLACHVLIVSLMYIYVYIWSFRDEQTHDVGLVYEKLGTLPSCLWYVLTLLTKQPPRHQVGSHDQQVDQTEQKNTRVLSKNEQDMEDEIKRIEHIMTQTLMEMFTTSRESYKRS